MQTIEYYSIDSLTAYTDRPDRLPKPLQFNYGDRQKLIDIAIAEYKPRFDLDKVHAAIRLSHTQKDGDKNYCNSLYTFSEIGVGSGYYNILTGEIKHKIEGNTIEFNTELNIQFTEAKRIFIPEVKIAGQPYQPKRIKVETIKVYDPVPLFMCKKYSGKTIYSTNNNMDNRYKTFRATVSDKLYIAKNVLEIY